MFLLDEVKNIDAYTQTKNDPQEITDKYKKRLLVPNILWISYWFTIDLEELWLVSYWYLFAFLHCSLNSDPWIVAGFL